jgi:hypothetical protein
MTVDSADDLDGDGMSDWWENSFAREDKPGLDTTIDDSQIAFVMERFTLWRKETLLFK